MRLLTDQVSRAEESSREYGFSPHRGLPLSSIRASILRVSHDVLFPPPRTCHACSCQSQSCRSVHVRLCGVFVEDAAAQECSRHPRLLTYLRTGSRVDNRFEPAYNSGWVRVLHGEHRVPTAVGPHIRKGELAMGDGTQPSGSPVPSEISLPLSFHVSEHVVSRYATNFVVQCTGQEFILSFFEALPPFLLGDNPEENRAILEQAGRVHAECVARVVVSPERMRQFAAVVESAVTRYDAEKELGDE